MNFRIESDLLGELQVPEDAYYGVQTQRAVNNFKISGQRASSYPQLIKALGLVKKAAAQTNHELGVLTKNLFVIIDKACDDVIAGKLNDQFPVDMIQGGAGTSVNMNANEVIANRALEIAGYQKGQYEICSPNDHVNLSQSTNDAYPTAIKIALYLMNKSLCAGIEKAVRAFGRKGVEFAGIIKMGRTQLQDAVPMTLGQEFDAFATTLQKEIANLNWAASHLLEVNMGGTAIGTGLNAPTGFAGTCAANLATLTGLPVTSSHNLIEATVDTGAFTQYSSALRNFSLKLSKVCNDLRLLSSGPKAGLSEINLPPMQPGSSIMPGKVNPVMPEVVNQVCFKVAGNDLTVAMAAEAGQLQLNVMEPVICHAIMESIQFLENALDALVEKCIDGITANHDLCLNLVRNSIGIVTALNPYIGYKNSTRIAREALTSGKTVYELVLELQTLTRAELDEILSPANMIRKN